MDYFQEMFQMFGFWWRDYLNRFAIEDRLFGANLETKLRWWLTRNIEKLTYNKIFEPWWDVGETSVTWWKWWLLFEWKCNEDPEYIHSHVSRLLSVLAGSWLLNSLDASIAGQGKKLTINSFSSRGMLMMQFCAETRSVEYTFVEFWRIRKLVTIANGCTSHMFFYWIPFCCYVICRCLHDQVQQVWNRLCD